MRQNTYTKESIKARMFKRVAALWNIRNTDMLDPVVKLLIEVLASEIFKLSGELNDVEDRVVEKLASAFTPSHMMAASPAHAIAHARALEGRFEIPSDAEFVYKDPHFIQKHNLRKLSFTPTITVPVINGDVAALISLGKYYEVSPRSGREHTANGIRQSPLYTHTAWIGLEVSKEVESLKDICFYFDFPLLDSTENYLRLINHSKCYSRKKKLAITSGLPSDSTDVGVFGLFDPIRHLNDEISGKYHNHFITLTEDIQTSDLKREAVPEEIVHLFDEGTINKLRDDLIWLKIVFPPAFDDTALSQMTVHINCFPVANVYKKQTSVTATQLSSIIPIEKEYNEYYLFMNSVIDSHNNLYKQVQNHDDNNVAGTYMIRRGGSERFNSLNARDFLERLLDLYRDESIAFSSIDRDISTTSQSLIEHLSQFEKKLESYDNDAELTSYLILSSDISTRIKLTMRYCLTNGAIANHIRSSEMLEIPQISDINPASITLMTATRGGRKSPPESTRKDIYKYLLTTRDRIYTKDDIRMFCKCYYGDCFENVRIEDSYEVSSKPKQGFVKTMNIILEGTKERFLTDPELLKRDIYSGLTQRSPEDFEYKIVIN
ncbi:type VI secretion system baseplate subunit TssF [Bacteroides sp. 224]|uniref:type VI secretion system baseplate subunit TssF n=1 Tax=Bacteroides sp. 224 TaxID=2302936 RepID=UPI0013D87485|nr:type VI secretion system baseplate subunit TssF [Bacteroides sp. 224]